MYTWTDGTELYHHGVLGMKWGVRRYQNYDGSLTQKGVKRYNKSKEAYDKANERYKTAKKNKASDTEITNARLQRKKAKSQLNKDYDHLKQDKMADQGKKLYSKGETILGNRSKTYFIGKVGLTGIAAAKALYSNGIISSSVRNSLETVGSMTVSAAAVKYGIDAYKAKRLSAYYAHTSDY